VVAYGSLVGAKQVRNPEIDLGALEGTKARDEKSLK
jgi:hypothetical protein